MRTKPELYPFYPPMNRAPNIRMTSSVYVALIAVCLMVSHCAQAQGHWDQSREISISGGTSYYIGDINPDKHFGTRMKFGGGISYRENVNRRVSIRGGVNFHRVEAWDEDSDDPWQVNRNLHFRNDFVEFSLMFEVNFWDYQILTSDRFTPYLTAGIGYYGMQPQALYDGVWFDLQPLGTEGQGTSEGAQFYSANGFSIPMGAGFKMNLTSILGLGVEWTFHKTWTDYFDDVSGYYADPTILLDESGPLSLAMADRSIVQGGPSGSNTGMQRGDPGKNDWFAFCQVSLNIRLDKPPGSCFRNHHFK